MQILVYGAGPIGSAIAKDLSDRSEVQKVGILDNSEDRLEEAVRNVASEKLISHHIDVNDIEIAAQVLADYDVGAIALANRRASYRAVESAILARRHVVDILEEYHRRPDQNEDEGLERPEGMSRDDYGDDLHKRAKHEGVTILDGMGFAPGLSNVTLGDGVRKLEEDYSVPLSKISTVARVGGIPSRKSTEGRPLNYMITWSFEHVLREYMIGSKVIRDGTEVEVGAMAEMEEFDFNEFERNEKLECFVTPGMPSFPHTRGELKEFSEKTIRWPGHWQAIQILKECGMLDIDRRIQVEGFEITPRKFLSRVLTPMLRSSDNDTDACVMWNTAVSAADNVAIHHYLWHETSPGDRLTAMQSVTAFTAAAAAVMLCRNLIEKRGIVAPEDGISGKLYQMLIQTLKARTILVKEVVRGT